MAASRAFISAGKIKKEDNHGAADRVFDIRYGHAIGLATCGGSGGRTGPASFSSEVRCVLTASICPRPLSPGL